MRCLAAVAVLFCASAFGAPSVALTGATLIDGRGGPPVAGAVVVVRNGRIECAGARCPIPAGARRVDLRGKYVTPGLIDTHVHFSQTGWADGRPDALDIRTQHPYEEVVARLQRAPEAFARSYLCAGVTSVFDVGGYPWTLRLAERLQADPNAPRIAAAGPLLSTLDHWLNLPAERQFIHLKDDAAAREGVRYLAAQGARAVKVWFLVTPAQPVEASTPAVLAAGAAARAAGLPLIVHATGLAESKVAIRAGAKLLVHSVWEPVDDEFIALAREHGTMLSPTLTVVRGYARMGAAAAAHEAPPLDDPQGCVDRDTVARVASTATLEVPLPPPEQMAGQAAYFAQIESVAAANLKRLVDAGIPIATGTDAGNPLTLHGPAIYAEMEAMQAAGMTPMQVIVATTATAARAAGFDSETGALEAGKSADLLVVDADPSADVANFRRLRQVMRGGVLQDVAQLRARK